MYLNEASPVYYKMCIDLMRGRCNLSKKSGTFDKLKSMYEVGMSSSKSSIPDMSEEDMNCIVLKLDQNMLSMTDRMLHIHMC